MCRYIFAGFLALFYLGHFTDARTLFQPVRMPSICGHKTYCTEKNPDYPDDAIEYLLMAFDDMWQEIVNDTTPIKRQGLLNNECSSTHVTDPVYEMIDEYDNLRYVVQNKKRFNQIIHMEECNNPGPIVNETYDLSRTILNKTVFECQQKYLDFKFVVLSLDGTKLEAVKMKNNVPVCCACVFKEQNNE